MENITVIQGAKSERFRFEIRSVIGGRQEQQDRACVYAAKSELFAAVCDGMGGTADGGRASEIAVDTMIRAYAQSPAREAEEVPRFLLDAAREADRRVWEELGRGKSGATIVSAVAREDRLFWLSVGDSRLYIARAGELLQATRDHNYGLRLDELLTSGAITRAQYDDQAERVDALISYLGMGGIDLYDLTEVGFPLQSGDVVLLATDGLYRALSQEQLRDILNLEDLALGRRADMLLKCACQMLEEEYQDNTTFVMISVL